MAKLVVLRLEGDLDRGFRVHLEIREESSLPQIEATGCLPPAPELARAWQQWQEKYRGVGLPYRIKPGAIAYNAPVGPNPCSINECRRLARELSDRLNSWLRSEPFREIDTRLREELNKDEPIRLLICTQNSHLQKLPWHLWDFVCRYPFAEVALSPLNYHKPLSSLRSHTSNKVRILAILGHAQGIDIEKDRQLLESLPNAEILFLVEPKRSEISDRFWNQPWDIIFFAGHSETEGEVGKIYLNQTDSLTLDELWYALRKAVDNGLQLAIFNSCDGLGLAKQLDDLQIPQIIVMREVVPDLVAQEFLKHFLISFSRGKSFYLAVREARERLESLEKEYPCATWLPLICQNPAVLPPTWADFLHNNKINTAVNYSSKNQAEKESKKNKKSAFLKFNKKLGLAALLLCGLGFFGWQSGLPKLAIIANNYGFKSYQKGNFSQAIAAWNLVTTLNPKNPAAPYNLGWICEKVQDFDCAKKQYLKSAKLDLDAAYSQLGRLYIKEKNYAPAVNLLFEGLERATDDRIKYSLQKNIGWARLEQGRYEEALFHLREAIKLDSDRASARCLLAQVLEGQGDNKAAIVEWQTCLDNAKPEHPDEDIWIGMARQRLKAVYGFEGNEKNTKKCKVAEGTTPCPS